MQQDANQTDPRRTPIVILHGWVVDSQVESKWSQLIAQLKTQGYEVHFLLIPGLSAPLAAEWTISDYCLWLESELKKMGAQSVVLIGHSFGGHLAISFTHRFPEKVQRLVLIDSSGLRNHSLLANFKRSLFKSMAKMGKFFTANQQARKLLYKLARESDYESASPNLRATMSNIVNHEVIQEAGTITCPVLILWGENDQVTPLPIGKQLHQLIPQSQLQVIFQARHSPPYTHSQAVAHQILTFLDPDSREAAL